MKPNLLPARVFVRKTRPACVKRGRIRSSCAQSVVFPAAHLEQLRADRQTGGQVHGGAEPEGKPLVRVFYSPRLTSVAPRITALIQLYSDLFK